MTIASVLAAESNMAALGVGVLLLGGWIAGGIVLFRSGAKRKRAEEMAANELEQSEPPASTLEP